MKRWFLLTSLLVFVVFSAVSCATVKTNNYSWTTMSRNEVFNFIYYTNHVVCNGGPIVNQSNYCVPTVAWVNEVYAPFLKQFLFNQNVSSPNMTDNDCAKFSIYGQAAGEILHYAHKEGPAGFSLAIGITDYSQGLFEYSHSVNFFIAVDKSGKKVIYYFEPQTQSAATGDIENNWWFFKM